MKKIKTEFKFVLPNGSGFATDSSDGKVYGVMRLLKVKDIVDMETDMSVKANTGMYYVAMLARCIKKLGKIEYVNRTQIEKLVPVDFAFLIDFLNEINHQVIKKIPVSCSHCGHKFIGVLSRLGEI